jgi:hypothetical protein
VRKRSGKNQTIKGMSRSGGRRKEVEEEKREDVKEDIREIEQTINSLSETETSAAKPVFNWSWQAIRVCQ